MAGGSSPELDELDPGAFVVGGVPLLEPELELALVLVLVVGGEVGVGLVVEGGLAVGLIGLAVEGGLGLGVLVEPLEPPELLDVGPGSSWTPS